MHMPLEILNQQNVLKIYIRNKDELLLLVNYFLFNHHQWYNKFGVFSFFVATNTPTKFKFFFLDFGRSQKFFITLKQTLLGIREVFFRKICSKNRQTRKILSKISRFYRWTRESFLVNKKAHFHLLFFGIENVERIRIFITCACGLLI